MPDIIDVSPNCSNAISSTGNRSITGRMLSIASSPDGRTVYAGSYANLWVSHDAGLSWTQLTWPQPPPDQFDAPGSLGGWCIVDIAVGAGWQIGRDPRLVARLTRRGHADVLGFGDCGVWTALGNGDGTFSQANFVLSNFGFQQGWRVASHPRLVADLTGDRAGDIVGFGDAGVWTALGNGDGTFGEARFVLENFAVEQEWRVDRHPRFLADLTGDGRADIVGFGDAGVWTALGNGDGTFGDASYVLARFGYHQGWRVERHPRVLADLTGDGKADIIGFGDAGVWVALGNGDGTFGDPIHGLANFGYHQGWRVDRHARFVADLTGNGQADIVGFGDAGVWTALGNGDGTFEPAQYVLANLGYDQGWRVTDHPRFVTDLIGDGRADVVGCGDAGVWTALGNGDGTLQDANLVLADFGYQQGWQGAEYPRFTADLNGDGRSDLLGFGDRGVETAIGNGDGTFRAVVSALTDFCAGPTVVVITVNDLALGSRGIWRSADGGTTWAQAHQFPPGESVGQLIWAPGSDHLVYAAGGSSLAVSTNGGGSFTDVYPWGEGGGEVYHIALVQNGPADPAPAVIYALGPRRMALSFDGGAGWMVDGGTLPSAIGGPVSSIANGNAPSVFVVSPRWPLEVYVAEDANSGHGLWRGDYSQFLFGSHQSSWESVPVPQGSQDSGNVFLATTHRGRGDLLFYGAQQPIAHVGPLYPNDASDWTALHGVHYDLHGILLSPDFSATLRGGDYVPSAGILFLLSDGGIARSTNGGMSFQQVCGVESLSCVNIAGVALPHRGPALSLNTGDNDGFYSVTGGLNWGYQQYGGGDDDCSFADPLRPHSMLVFTPRWDTNGGGSSARHGQTVAVYESHTGQLPDCGVGTNDRRIVTGPPVLPDSEPYRDIWNASSYYGNRGSRPIVLGRPDEKAPAQGDYAFILFPTDDQAVLVRTQTILDITSRTEWVTSATGPGQGANVYRQGPDLPDRAIGVVQASGGHWKTVFYVGGNYGAGLWMWKDGMTDWTQLVPGNGAEYAVRFFVDPYRPNLIYILDIDHVKRSDDGGTTWQVDQNLETQLTWNGRIAITYGDDTSGLGDHYDTVLTDMQFDPSNPLVRFATGKGGVFTTEDGVSWTRLLHTGALAGRPTNSYYDRISRPGEPALYVGFAGRSILKIVPHPVPPVMVTVPDLFEYSAAAAATMLENRGLVPVFAGPSGTGAWVWAQSPTAGTVVPEGTSVHLTMHTGPLP